MSVAIVGFCIRIEVEGEIFEFKHVKELEQLPKEKAMLILEHILFVERPALLYEASKIPHLQDTIKKITEEKDFFFRKAQSIEDLSAKIVQYRHENDEMKNEINSLKKAVRDISNQYEKVSNELSSVSTRLEAVIQPISARQIATNADNAAIAAIFPQCRSKPYCLRSYSNLLSFLAKPESDEYTGPLAPAAWLKMGEEERAAIKSKADKFAENNPYLKISIKTLKSEAWKQAHTTTTVEETLDYYKQQGDEEACDAVNVCASFLGLATLDNEASETEAK